MFISFISSGLSSLDSVPSKIVNTICSSPIFVSTGSHCMLVSSLKIIFTFCPKIQAFSKCLIFLSLIADVVTGEIGRSERLFTLFKISCIFSERFFKRIFSQQFFNSLNKDTSLEEKEMPTGKF